MSSNLKIMGNESEVLFLNVNKKNINFPKLLITKSKIYNNIESGNITKHLLDFNENPNNKETLNELNNINFLETTFTSTFEEELNTNLNLLSKSFLNFELKDLKFTQFSNNLRYTIIIRNQNFTNSFYNLERGQITYNIKKSLKTYFHSISRLKNVSNLENFQIEIYENFDIKKNITLKKENNNIILSSNFGYLKNHFIDYNFGSELYFSLNEKFLFFENSQKTALLKENNNLIIKNIQTQEKILSNNELIKINEITKEVNDVIIDLIITNKNELKILNVTYITSFGSESGKNGFIIYKSSNNLSNISLISIREINQQTTNPKFLLIRTEDDFCELLNNLKILNNISGIVFNSNFYNQIFEEIGKNLNIDILFYYTKLAKADESEINFDDFQINQKEQINPFENILTKKKLEEVESPKDAWLNHLSNVNLETSNNSQQEENFSENISNITNSILSSENSNTKSYNYIEPSKVENSNYNTSKSALSFMAENVKNQLNKNNNNDINKKLKSPSPTYDSNSTFSKPKEEKIIEIEKVNTDFDLFSNSSNKSSEKIEMNKVVENDNLNSENKIQDLFSEIKETQPVKIEENKLEKYLNLLSTKIYTNRDINSNNYFVDNLENITKNENILFFTNKREDIKNNVKYIFNKNSIDKNIILEKNDCLILNSFLDIKETQKDNEIDYFLNLVKIGELKEDFLKTGIDKFDRISIFLKIENVDLIENIISKLNNVYFVDLNTSEKYEEVKNKLLIFEKRYLLKLN
jgi:hypothetical protein